MPLRKPKERPQREREIVVAARRKGEAIKEPRDIIRHECAHIAVKRLGAVLKPVAQIGKVNIAHAFGGLCRNHRGNRVRDRLPLQRVSMMPGIEARCIT